jgi:hypothetical protein
MKYRQDAAPAEGRINYIADDALHDPPALVQERERSGTAVCCWTTMEHRLAMSQANCRRSPTVAAGQVSKEKVVNDAYERIFASSSCRNC